MYTIKKQKSAAKKSAEPEIQGILHALSVVYEQYRQQFLIAVTAVLAVIVVYGGYSLYQAGSEGKASALLSRAYGPYGAGTPDYGKALELFQDIQKNYPSTLSGAIAQYYIGNCLMGMGQPQQAVKAYEDFVKRYAGKKELLGLVYQRMGFAYESLGDSKEALAAFERGESLLGPGVLTIEMAHLYEKLGKTDEAQKKYMLAAGKLAGTALAEEAKRNIAAPSGAAAPESAPRKSGK